MRSRNIGTQLISEVQKYCQKVGMPNIKVEVATQNTRSLRFYEQRGFTNRQSILFRS